MERIVFRMILRIGFKKSSEVITVFDETWNKYMEEKSEGIKLSKEDITSMIDLALITNDRNWFFELTKRKDGLNEI